MTYLDYINQFWRLNEAQPFTLGETKVYMYLLYIANANGWIQPFQLSDMKAAGSIGISINTFKVARSGIIKRKLISFDGGHRGQHNMGKYQLLSQNLILNKDKCQDKHQDKCQDKCQNLIEKEKNPPLTPLIKEKEINKEKERDKEPLAQGITILSDPSLSPLIPLEDIMANIRLTQQQWVERFCMNNQINPTAFNIWTDLFIRDLESRNIKSKSIPDFTDHFAKWFLYQKDKKNGNKQHSRQEQRQQDEILTATALSDRIAELDANYLRRSQATGSGTHQDVPQTLRTDSDIQPDCGDYPFR